MATFTSNFGALNTGPIGDTYRSLGSDWFNGANIAREDWIRNEQAAENQAARDLFIQERMSDKNYDLSREYLRNQSKDMVEGLKAAGLNPILAVNNSGMSNLSTNTGARSGAFNQSKTNGTNSLGSLLNVVSGIISAVGVLTGNLSSIAAAKAPKTIQKIYIKGK